jgi:hypothetical protein
MEKKGEGEEGWKDEWMDEEGFSWRRTSAVTDRPEKEFLGEGEKGRLISSRF